MYVLAGNAFSCPVDTGVVSPGIEVGHWPQ